MRLEEFGHVGRHHRNRVAFADAAAAERAREPAAALVGLRPGIAARTMNDRGPRRIDRRRPLQERERRERHVIRGVALEPDLVGVGHGLTVARLTTEGTEDTEIHTAARSLIFLGGLGVLEVIL